jgi:hypothetical protein
MYPWSNRTLRRYDEMSSLALTLRRGRGTESEERYHKLDSSVDKKLVLVACQKAQTQLNSGMELSPCLLLLQIPNFYTIFPSHQSLDACMEHLM